MTIGYGASYEKQFDIDDMETSWGKLIYPSIGKLPHSLCVFLLPSFHHEVNRPLHHTPCNNSLLCQRHKHSDSVTHSETFFLVTYFLEAFT